MDFWEISAPDDLWEAKGLVTFRPYHAGSLLKKRVEPYVACPMKLQLSR